MILPHQNGGERKKTALTAAVKSKAETLKRYSEKRVLKDPMAFIDDRILQLGGLSDKLKLLTEHRLIETQNRIASSNEKLKVLTELNYLQYRMSSYLVYFLLGYHQHLYR